MEGSPQTYHNVVKGLNSQKATARQKAEETSEPMDMRYEKNTNLFLKTVRMILTLYGEDACSDAYHKYRKKRPREADDDDCC